GCGAAGRFRGLGAAGARADGADALLPPALVLGGQRGGVLPLRVPVRRGFFLAQFLQTGLGLSPLDAALRLGPWTGTLFLVAPIAGALADRVGERPLLVGGLALQAAGMGWIALIAGPGLAYTEMIAPLVVAGIGASMAIPPA